MQRHSQYGESSYRDTSRTLRNHLLLILLTVIVAYASAIPGAMVWTDHGDIVDGDLRIRESADLAAMLRLNREQYRMRTYGVPEQSAGTWQPLAILSYSLDWSLWGDCAACYHLENLYWHLLTALALYALGRHLLSHRRHASQIAFWAATLYAAHPATTASVAWIGARPILLASALTAWCLVIFTRLPATSKSYRVHTWRWWFSLSLSGGLAMLAHETAYLLPIAAFLVAAFEARERGRPGLRGIGASRWIGMALLIGVLLPILAFRLRVFGTLALPGGYPTTSLVDNSGMFLRHLWALLDQAYLPGEPVLADSWPIGDGWGSLEVSALLGLLLLLAASFVGFHYSHPAAFGLIWLLLWILPGSGLLPGPQFHTPHTLYLAAWGATLSVGYLLMRAWRPLGRQLARGSEAIVFVPVVLVLVFITAFSNLRWWDYQRLFEGEVANDPGYLEGRVQLVRVALADNKLVEALDRALAIIELARESKNASYWPQAETYALLAEAQYRLGLYVDAGKSIETALEFTPRDSRLLRRLAQTQIGDGKLAAAEASLRQALAIQPQFLQARGDLGAVLIGQDRVDVGLPLLEEALADGHGDFNQHKAMAIAMIHARRFDTARTHLERALLLQDDPIERARLAWVLWQGDHRIEARTQLSQVMRSDKRDNAFVRWVADQMGGF